MNKYTMQDVLNRVAQITPEQLAAYQSIDFYHITKHDACIEDFESNLQTNTYIGYSHEFQSNMTAYPISTWYCTDQMVGVLAYFFRNKFVALSFQQGRKWDVEIQWVSQECANEVREYILSLADGSDINAQLIDPTQELNNFWFEYQPN